MILVECRVARTNLFVTIVNASYCKAYATGRINVIQAATPAAAVAFTVNVLLARSLTDGAGY